MYAYIILNFIIKFTIFNMFLYLFYHLHFLTIKNNSKIISSIAIYITISLKKLCLQYKYNIVGQ